MPAARPVEVELKYRVSDGAAGERVLDGTALDGWEPAGATRTKQLEDRYVDTADGSIARAGFAARLRHGSDGTIVTVKALAARRESALHAREELEGPADPAFPAHDWPASAARSLVLELAGDAPLVELITIRQLRRVRPFSAGEARIEVSLDEVDVVSHGRIVEHFTELEAELREGPVEALEGLAVVLAGRAGLTPSPTSKLEIALAAAGIQRPGTGDAADVAPVERAARTAATDDGGSARRKAAPGQGRGTAATAGSSGAPAGDRAPGGGPAGADRQDGGAPEAATGTDGTATTGVAAASEGGRQSTDTAAGDGAPEATEAATTDVPGADVGSVEVVSADVASPEVESLRLVVGRTPGVRADDTLAEAGRKVLRFHLARMLAKEPGTRTGKDPEDLHSMRVATRRMRAAWRVFGEAYRPRRQRRYLRDLRDVAARLGAVRDLDVLIDELEGYINHLAEPERPNLAPLVDAWRHQREDARALLLRTLDAEPYRRFVDEYREFVRTEGLGVLPIAPADPHRVRDRMPTQIWAAYEQVRAYEPILRWADVETLHTLRIAAKRLRYTIEFVREPIGPEAAPLIERVVALQDHLGYLHDADVASGLARQFLVDRSAELSEAETAAIGRFLVDRERELSRLRRTVGAPWRRVAGLAFRRALGRAVANL